jgi:hypothetical protein
MISSWGVNWLFDGSGNSYPNNKDLTYTNLTSSHGSSQRLDKDLGHMWWLRSITLSNIPLFPKSPKLPLSNRYSLLKMNTLHIQHKTFRLSKMVLPQQSLLKSLTHSSSRLCWSLKKTCKTSRSLLDALGTSEAQASKFYEGQSLDQLFPLINYNPKSKIHSTLVSYQENLKT